MADIAGNSKAQAGQVPLLAKDDLGTGTKFLSDAYSPLAKAKAPGGKDAVDSSGTAYGRIFSGEAGKVMSGPMGGGAFSLAPVRDGGDLDRQKRVRSGKRKDIRDEFGVPVAVAKRAWKGGGQLESGGERKVGRKAGPDAGRAREENTKLETAPNGGRFFTLLKPGHGDATREFEKALEENLEVSRANGELRKADGPATISINKPMFLLKKPKQLAELEGDKKAFRNELVEKDRSWGSSIDRSVGNDDNSYSGAADELEKLRASALTNKPGFIRLPPEEADAAETGLLDGKPPQKTEEPGGMPPAKTAPEPTAPKAAQVELPDDEAWRPPVFKAVPVNPFVLTEKDRFSTFSIDVDTASYALARNYILRGYLPPAASVRMEEFVNAFDYNYPKPRDVFEVHAEAMPSPFGRGLVLLKIGVQGKVLGREGRKPAHLVFVVDASGSMARPDRMPLVQDALTLLIDQLGPRDRVSLVTYDTNPRLIFEAVAASRRREITGTIKAVQCGGSTNLLGGLELGYSIARRYFRSGEVNRVILCSDGVANVGLTDAKDMLAKVATFKDHGITFTSIGFGMGSYNDELLEMLANKGDGSYMFVDSLQEARRVFVEEMAATLQTIAGDVKIQVEFNPFRVRRYRLIGYENRDIADSDFRNDAVDAGEVGSGQSVTALYELELPGEAGCIEVGGLIGTVYVRYRDLDSGKVRELSRRLDRRLIGRRTPETAPRFFLAAAAAEFAEILRQSEHAQGGTLEKVRRIVEEVAVRLPLDQKVVELLHLIRRAEGLPRAQ